MANYPVSESVDLRVIAQTIKWQGFTQKIGGNKLSRFNFQLTWVENAPSWVKFMDQLALAVGLKVDLKIGMIDANTSEKTINLFDFKSNKDFKRYAGVDGQLDQDQIVTKNTIMSARITITKFNDGKPVDMKNNEIWFIIPENFSTFGVEMISEMQGPTNYN